MIKKYTVTGLTKLIKALIEFKFNKPVVVVGEVSSITSSTSGHYYFILKDETSSIKAVYFKKFFDEGISFYIPKNGDKVEVTGNLRVYEKDGLYQIIVKEISYDSVGDFYKKFEETKRKLEKEGLFDASFKKAIPFLPIRIAVLTSISGAALTDFLTVSKKNMAKYSVDVWPVQVQGSSAISEIVSSLERVNRFSHLYDVLVLMRGGGSLEDLSIFNEEAIVRALFSSKIPTISAIGHERDITICDLVADERAATPTAAAERLSKVYIDAYTRLDNAEKKLKKSMEFICFKYVQHFDKLHAKLETYSPLIKIENFKSKIYLYKEKLITTMKYYLQNKQTLIYLINSLKNSCVNKLNILKGNVEGIIKRLANLDPHLVLTRGYAIVKKNDQVLDTINNVNIDDEVEVIIKDGYFYSFVTGKKALEVLSGENTNYEGWIYKVKK